MTSKIGDLLVKENLITSSQLKQAQEALKQGGGRLYQMLVKLDIIDEEGLTNFLSKQYGVPSIDLKEFDIDPEVIKLLPKEVVEKYQILPVNRAGCTLILAMADPSNIYAIDDVKFLTGYNVEVVVAPETDLLEMINKYYEVALGVDQIMGEMGEVSEAIELSEGDIDASIVDLEKSAEEAPVIKLVNLVMIDAMRRNASDIHMEPYEKEFRVRYRIDGVLYEIMKPPKKMQNAIISRVKIMSKLDIAERRLPQDGRIKIKVGKNREMDFRVSVLPTLCGEKVVLRLLDKGTLQLDLTKLGFDEGQLKLIEDAIHKPYGMVLVTGPTGSGKTTTLYSALTELNKISENISTAEDPIEYNLPGINQVQMHDAIGLNFATSLRAFLRQDPDIIMVGEIRDLETAEIAVKAALTGHLVLSTLHTNDAPSAINRLLNMGVEPFLVSSSVNVILAQRLVRKICQGCKEEVKIPSQALIDIGVPSERVIAMKCYKGQGCKACSGTGFKGRIAVCEVMPVNEEIREFILGNKSAAELKREAIRIGMMTLRQSAIKKLMDGQTTFEEVIRVTMGDF